MVNVIFFFLKLGQQGDMVRFARSRERETHGSQAEESARPGRAHAWCVNTCRGGASSAVRLARSKRSMVGGKMNIGFNSDWGRKLLLGFEQKSNTI